MCSAHRATRQLHVKDGTVHNHGPRANPCPGSHEPPLSVSKPSVKGGFAERRRKLREVAEKKHPQASSTFASFLNTPVSFPLSVDESDVRKAVLSFPVGSSCRPMACDPNIADLIQCREPGSDFLDVTDRLY